MTISSVDYLGAETVLRMTHNGQTLFARIDGRRGYRPGEAIQICWPAKAIHRFGVDEVCIDTTKTRLMVT